MTAFIEVHGTLQVFSPHELVAFIDARSCSVLQREGELEFGHFHLIELSLDELSHLKLKTAIMKIVQELLCLNLDPAVKSGKDFLRKFSGVLKYGEQAKENRIMLSPRHVGRTADEADALRANTIDIMMGEARSLPLDSRAGQ